MAEEKKKENIRYFVRIANTDLDGNKQVMYALSKIKGVSIMLANAVCTLAGVDKFQKIGTLSEDKVKRLNQVIDDPLNNNVPEWMLNRRRDPETNEAGHIVGPNIRFVQDNDIKNMRRIKSYKGMRHARGLPVRGQRTKSNFRRSKSKGKGALGVKKPRK